MSERWRDTLLIPTDMTDADIRAELRHDLRVYEQVQHPLSKYAFAARIDRLVTELDRRAGVSSSPEAPGR